MHSQQRSVVEAPACLDERSRTWPAGIRLLEMNENEHTSERFEDESDPDEIEALTPAVLHELRQPLTAISGYTRLLQRREAYDPSALQHILDATRRLERLLSDLLDLSLMDVEQFTLRPSRVNLGSLVQTIVTEFQGLGPERRLRCELPSHPVVGWWDADRLSQVLANLIGNAIKYTSESDEIVCWVADHGNEAWITVADDGPGIPCSAQAKLFAPFHRAGSAESSHIRGQGLGLYVSKLLVEAHGGRIWVYSQPGQGSAFSVALPY